MITVSLQPFAFRKIVVLLAALLWLTATVLFADPVLMNARAQSIAMHSSARNATALLASNSPALSARKAATKPTVAQSDLAPAEGPSVHSISLDRLDTWSEFARPPFTSDAELTFWSFSLAR